jgi:hypothetical protein
VNYAARLARLERLLQAAKGPPGRAEWEALRDSHLAAAEAYVLRGEGAVPDDLPPPPGHPDPERWESQERIARCQFMRIRYDLAPGEYPPDLTAAERAHADERLYGDTWEVAKLMGTTDALPEWATAGVAWMRRHRP